MHPLASCPSTEGRWNDLQKAAMPNTDSNGVPIHHEVIGKGQPIVLVHGFSSSFDRDWRGSGWIEFLVGEKRQVIGLDCRGHGKSGKPHSPESYAGNQVPNRRLACLRYKNAIANKDFPLPGTAIIGT